MKYARLVMVTLVIMTGCQGSDPTELPPEALAEVALAVVGGAGQSDTIRATLPEAVEVEVRRGGNPVADVVVNFVTDDGCGRAFAGAVLSNANGRASDRWELGRKAGPCRMEARIIDQNGKPVVVSSVEATVLPGKPVEITTREAMGSAFVGDSIDFEPWFEMRDEAGNVASGVPTANVSAPVVQSGTKLWSGEERLEAFGLSIGAASTGSDALRAAWMTDLRSRGWTIEARCVSDEAPHPRKPDSVEVSSTASFEYEWLPGDGFTNLAGEVQASSTVTRFFPDSTSVADTVHAQRFLQHAGSLEMNDASFEGVGSYTGSACPWSFLRMDSGEATVS